MLAAAEKAQVVFLEAVRQIYMPGFQAIQENLHKLGTIRRASFSYCKYSSRYDNYKNGIIENAFNPNLSNGSLMDIGVYGVHMLGAFFGMPERIQSAGLKLSNGVDGEGTILAEYAGMLAEVTYSKISDLNIPAQIQGENGTMLIEQMTEPVKLTIISRDGSEEVIELPETEPPMVHEIRKFAELAEAGTVNHKYLENSRIPEKIREKEPPLTREDEMAEFMFLGLRMTRGISKAEFERQFGSEIDAIYGDVLRKYKSMGLLLEEKGRIFLSREGIHVSDSVMADFLP